MDTPHLHNLHKHLIHDLAKEHNLLGGVGWGVGGCQYKRVLFICAIKEVPKSPHTQETNQGDAKVTTHTKETNQGDAKVTTHTKETIPHSH